MGENNTAGKGQKRKREWGLPPKSGENRHVLSKRDAERFRGKIVAVDAWPEPGKYGKVIAAADSMSELKRDLRILGRDIERVVAHIMPGTDSICYVSACREMARIARKE